MSTPSTPSASPVRTASAGARRRRFALQTAVLMLAVTFACIFLGVIASNRKVRAEFDLTSTRQHRLSGRTENVLKTLSGPYEIVVAADMRTVDALSAARTRDVLDGFARASEHVRVRIIDTASARGVKEFDSLLTDLAAGYKPQIDEQRAVVDASLNASQGVIDGLTKLAADLQAAREQVKDSDTQAATLREVLLNDAARCRVGADRLTRALTAVRVMLERPIGATRLPAIDVAAAELSAALKAVSGDLGEVQRRAESMAGMREISEVVRDRLTPIARSFREQRENADRAGESLERLGVLPIIAVARILERTSAALVIGPPRAAADGKTKAGTITAVEFEALFPPRLPEEARTGSVDLRSRAEELLATAIASLGNVQAPIVMLVHDQPVRLGASLDRFAGLIDRLRLRGMDLVEWAVAVDPDQPALARIDPAGTRPVVYATLASAADSAEAAMRMKRMVDVQNRLVSEGRPVLLSLNVSSRPGIGDQDPLTECLIPLGIEADTGRPLLRQSQGPNGRIVTPDLFIIDSVDGASETGHPIARAVNGLRCHFSWPVSVKPKEPAIAGMRVMPLLRVASKDVWAESEWRPFAMTPIADRPFLANPPAGDSARDAVAGPFTVVAGVELTRQGAGKPQRVVVVGCAPWFLDDVTQVSLGVVDGRPVLRAPGNIELFESAVYWLAGQDDMIARSATAESIPVIPALSSTQVSVMRWLLIAGMPVVVLLLGAAWRLTRG